MQFPASNADIYGQNPFGNGRNMAAQQRARQSPLRGCLGCLAPVLILVCLGGVVSILFGVRLIGGPTVIQVGSHPTLIVESDAYSNLVIDKPVLHIHAGGPSGQILIYPHHLLGIPFGFPEIYHEASDHQTVIYDYNAQPNATGTFDITVPAQTNLKVDTDNWSVQVEGITGQMVLTSNGGDLTVTNCHLSGPSLLRDNSGAISLQGLLDPTGTYQLANNSGPITATLPQSAHVHIDAATTSGAITSTVPQTKVQQGTSGANLHTNVGTVPRAGLALSNNSGSITINDQGGN